MIKKKKTIRCPKCKYLWETKTKKRNVTCPDCLVKVNIAENEVDESKYAK